MGETETAIRVQEFIPRQCGEHGHVRALRRRRRTATLTKPQYITELKQGTAKGLKHMSAAASSSTRPKTIAIHLRTEHTLVDHVRDQVAAREGIATEHQRLMYAGKQLIRGNLSLEDYGMTDKCTPHLLGRVRGGMPEAGGDGSSSSKRPRLAFEEPMDMEAARLDSLHARWKVWFETCAPIATAFLAPEAKVAEALGYGERTTRQGLIEAGVQEMVHWAAPNKPNHEVLLALAAYEKAKPYKVDLLQGKWVEAPKPPQGQP